MIAIIIIIGIIWFFSSGGSGGNSNNTQNRNNKDHSISNAYSSHTSHSRSDNTSSAVTNQSKVQKSNQDYKCTKCQHSHNIQVKVCEKCGWELSKRHIKFSTNLAGVTYDGRQKIIAQTSQFEKISLRRDKNNRHDRNAVGVYNANGRSLGWLPKGFAAIIAPEMDKGIEFYSEIIKIVGGNGYNYGIQVRISNDLLKMEKSTSITKPNTKSTPNLLTKKSLDSSNQGEQQGKVVSATAVAEKISDGENSNKSTIPRISESIYLDNALLRYAEKESYEEVIQVLSDFVKYKEVILPNLNRQNMDNLLISDFVCVFDNTIMLAGGRESNFILRNYKTILIQLAFQLGFLIHRLLPETTYASYAQGKMNWLSTRDVRLETNLLQNFFNKNVILNDESPIVYDSTKNNQIQLWDIDEIAYVLSHLTELGQQFKKFIDRN
ncbi:HIRAN domain-containing protein [Niallia sp. MER TA 168]|uniref:HIRAN domain-containing protein n=1 Tax=Niallia sp. MER TA 168 TaxID=2939568 RepID=UPI00203E7C04|nr:HIRAN domain-containing protein [Niallia sp. MER TA 168]MCM3364885.1 HIRAN domain-containing protein [Niallia sp. MER TA 168]